MPTTLVDARRVAKKSIAGVTLTTQRGTLINLDKNGQPLRPAMVWLDQRRTEGLEAGRGMCGGWPSHCRA